MTPIDSPKGRFTYDDHAPVVFNGRVIRLWMNSELTEDELKYLYLTEGFVREGGGFGCYATIRTFCQKLNKSHRTVHRIRQSLLKKKHLFKVGEISEAKKNGKIITRPVFKTDYSDSFGLPTTPTIGRPPTSGASRDTLTLRVPAVTPKEDKKNTKDINTRGVPPARPLTSNKNNTNMPSKLTNTLIPQPTQESPVEEKLARRLWKHLRDNRKDLPDNTPLPATFPKKVWPLKMKKLVKLVGETAVSSLLERLIDNWKSLREDERPASVGQFCSPGYFQHVLPKLLDKHLAAKPVKLPDTLRPDWDAVRDLHWPGDKAAVKSALIRSDAEFQKLWKKLKVLRRRQDEMVPYAKNPKYKVRRTLEPWEAAGVKLFEQADSMRIGDVFVRLFEMVGHLGAKAVPDYSGPKFTVTLAKIDRHLVLGKFINRDTEAGQKLFDYLQKEKCD